MILADTSVWVDHLCAGDAELAARLNANLILTHPFVIGELACGNLRNRTETLTLLKDLSKAPQAADDEVLAYIERQALMGRGIGYVDAHLLAAAALGDGVRLWTRDKRLRAMAASLGLAFEKH